MTHEPKTGSRNRRLKFKARFWLPFFCAGCISHAKPVLIYGVKMNLADRWVFFTWKFISFLVTPLCYAI